MLAGTLEISMLANMARLQSDMDKAKSMVGGAMKNIEGAVASAKAALGALGIGLSAGYFVSLIKGSIDAADAINDLSQRVGIAVKDLAKYQLATEQSGTSMESLAKGIKGISTNLIEHGEALKKAGLSATTADGAMRQLADLFQKMPDGMEKTALAVKLFGKAGMDLIPMLNMGSKGLDEAAEKSAKYAAVMAAMAPQADAFNDNLAELGMLSKIAGMNMVNGMLPALVSISKAMAEAAQKGGMLAGIWAGLDEIGNRLFDWSGHQQRKNISNLTDDLKDLHEQQSLITLDIFGRKGQIQKDIEEKTAALNAAKAAYFGLNSAAGAGRGSVNPEIVNPDKGGISDWMAEYKKMMAALQSGTGAAANDKELTSMLALIKATQDRIAVIKAQSLTMEPLTEGEKKYAELMNTSTKGYSAAAIAARDQEKALLLVEIALEKTAAARAADTAALAKYQGATQANIDKLKEEAASTNLTGTALQKITAARAIDKAASDAIFKTKTDELGVTQQVLAVTPKMAEQILIKAAADKAETSALIEKIDAQKLSIQYEQEIAKLKEGNGLYIDAEAKAIADLDIEAAKRLKVIDGLKAESEARKKLEADYAQWYQLSMEKIGADKLNSLWQSVDQAAQTTFDNIFQGGQNAFTKLRDTLKTGLLDLLYQMTVKKWVFSIFASVTGGGSTLANAAGMGGGGGGGILGMAANGASMYNGLTSGTGMLGTVGNWLGLGATGGAVGAGAWGSAAVAGSYAAPGIGAVGSLGGAAAGSSTGIMGALGAIPGWGWALAGLALLGPSLFGHTLKDSGIQGTFGGDKGFEGNSYKYYEGGLFSSDKTDIGALDETVRRTLGDTFNAMKTQVTDFATALGLSTDKLKGFTSDVKISLKGLSDADAQKKIQDALATANNDLAQQVIGTWVTTTQDVIRQVQNTAAAMEAGAGATSSVTSSETTSVYKPSEFAHEGEKAIDTLKRLATSLETANTWLTRFGASLFDASLAGGSQASDFIDKTGGQDAFNSQASSYFNNYYTSAQKYQAAQDEIAKKLKDAGVAMPQTASEFKAAMDQFLAMGVAGQDGAAALLSVNDAFAQIHGTIGQLEQAMGVSADSLKGILDDVRKNATSAADAKKMASQKFEDSIYTGLGNAMTQGLSQMIMNAVVGPLVNGLLAGATGSAAALTAGGVAGGTSSAAGGAAAGGAVASGGAAAGAAMAQGGAMAGAAVASTIDQARTYMAGFAAIMADPTVRDTIGQIAAGFGDIAASMPGLSGGASSVSSAMSSAGSSAGGMSSAVSQLGDTIDTEVKRLRGLMVTDSTNSAVSSAVLMAQFTTDTAKARAGDQTALAALAGLSQQIEAQAQLTATSSVDLARTRGWLAGSLAQTNALAKHIVDNPPSSLSLDPTLPPPGASDQWAGPSTGYSHTDAQGRPLRDTFFGYSPGTPPPSPAPDGFAFGYTPPDPWNGYPDPSNTGLNSQFPAYAQGTPYVPNDGLAYLHTGEAVIPAAYNKSNAGQDSAVLQELRALRSEVTSLRTQQASNHLDAQRLRLRPAKTLERWEQGGMPTTRQDGVIA